MVHDSRQPASSDASDAGCRPSSTAAPDTDSATACTASAFAAACAARAGTAPTLHPWPSAKTASSASASRRKAAPRRLRAFAAAATIGNMTAGASPLGSRVAQASLRPEAIRTDLSAQRRSTQPQRVCDNRGNSQVHRQRGDHRRQQPVSERILQARRKRDSEHLVDEHGNLPSTIRINLLRRQSHTDRPRLSRISHPADRTVRAGNTSASQLYSAMSMQPLRWPPMRSTAPASVSNSVYRVLAATLVELPI